MAQQPLTDPQLEHLIVDSGAIIRGHGLSFFNRAQKVWTVAEVMQEIRDSKARELLDSLPFPIEIRSPSEAAMKAVAEFSRKTGDFAALSLTDMKLIALLYTLECEVNGTKHIRTAPKVYLATKIC